MILMALPPSHGGHLGKFTIQVALPHELCRCLGIFAGKSPHSFSTWGLLRGVSRKWTLLCVYSFHRLVLIKSIPVSQAWEKSTQSSFWPLMTDFQQHWMRFCGQIIKCHPLNHKVTVWTLSTALQYCQLAFKAHKLGKQVSLTVELEPGQF